MLAGLLSNLSFGRIGLSNKLPPQLGQIPFSTLSTQSLQKVHSKVQIIASLDSGGNGLLQFSQLGLNSNI